MKKITAVVSVFVLILISFVSCSKGNSKQSTQGILGEEPVTITFWHCASDDAGVLIDKYVKEFNETNPYKITVNAIYEGQYSDATTLMKTIVFAENWKELPDIMQLDATGKVAYFDSGKAFTIDDAVAFFKDDIKKNYLTSAMGNWQFAGKQLGLPFAVSTTITYYNKDILKAAGWDYCPDTFSDVIKLAEDMKKVGIKADAYGTVPNSPSLANWIGQLGSYVVNNSNGTDDYATKLVCIDNGALRTFLTEWKNMYDKGGVQNKSLSTNQFVSGQVAIFTDSSSKVNSILSKVGGKFQVGTGAYLRVNDKASHGAAVSGSCLVMFDSENDLKKAATWEFMKYMTGAKVQADFAIGTGYTPSNLEALTSDVYKELLAKIPQFTTAGEQLEKTSAEMKSLTVGPTIDFYYAIQNEVSSMLAENKSVDSALNSMAEDLQGLLDNWARTNL